MNEYDDEFKKEYGRYFNDIDGIIDDDFCNPIKKKEYIRLALCCLIQEVKLRTRQEVTAETKELLTHILK